MNDIPEECQEIDLSSPIQLRIDEAEVTDLLKARADWYRLESREHDKTRPDKKEGDWVGFNQAIVRAGYWLSPSDMPEQKALERAYQLVALTANQYRAGVPSIRIVKGPNGYPGLGIDEIMVRAVVKALGPRSEKSILRGVLWGARQEWANEMRWQVGKKDPRIDLTLRTFYYIDLPQTMFGQIDRIRGRWIGRYHQGTPGGWGYWEPVELDLPYLENWVSQQVYEVRVQGQAFLVHPLDINPPEENHGPPAHEDLL